MKRFSPFPRVNSTYGAPMGRRDTRNQPFEHDANLCVSKPQGEYDSGGAYWGTCRTEGPVYAVWQRGKGHDGVSYVRAKSAAQAVRFAKEAA